MSDNLRGLLIALISAGLFAIVAAMAKIAVQDYHVLQILFIRQLIIFLSVVPSLLVSFQITLGTKFPFIHSLRIAGAFVALSSSIWAVAFLPLATAITLGFSQVFFAVVFARLFLNEDIGLQRIAAVLLGFAGVVVVLRPGFEGLFNIYGIIPIAGALGAAIARTCVRTLSQTESTATLLSFQAIFLGLASGLPMIWLWKMPDFNGLMLLVGMGVISTIAQWLGVKALRLAELGVVGPVEYVKLIYAAILGYLLFSEIPDFYTLLGAMIIVGSSLFILHREISIARAKQQSA